jgi:hypothetical protein
VQQHAASSGHNVVYRESESDKECNIAQQKGTAKRVQQHAASGGQNPFEKGFWTPKTFFFMVRTMQSAGHHRASFLNSSM